ncbi:Hypothetical predicted protein [Paramuricea clavata]|uniref:Uncharacterized protein n=1 Tax=Paramuricea clavata TaxID=317549 RepID=A0A7D9LV04_PARCT|nr:Hypothetical predicted protein [Paramuricea clavata]
MDEINWAQEDAFEAKRLKDLSILRGSDAFLLFQERLGSELSSWKYWDEMIEPLKKKQLDISHFLFTAERLGTSGEDAILDDFITYLYITYKCGVSEKSKPTQCAKVLKVLFEGESCPLLYNEDDAWFDDEDEEFCFTEDNKWFEDAWVQGLEEKEKMRSGYRKAAEQAMEQAMEALEEAQKQFDAAQFDFDSQDKTVENVSL